MRKIMIKNFIYSLIFISGSLSCMQTPIPHHMENNNHHEPTHRVELEDEYDVRHNYIDIHTYRINRGHVVLWTAAAISYGAAELADKYMPTEPNTCPVRPPLSACLQAAAGVSFLTSGIFGIAESCSQHCADVCTIL